MPDSGQQWGVGGSRGTGLLQHIPLVTQNGQAVGGLLSVVIMVLMYIVYVCSVLTKDVAGYCIPNNNSNCKFRYQGYFSLAFHQSVHQSLRRCWEVMRTLW